MNLEKIGTGFLMMALCFSACNEMDPTPSEPDGTEEKPDTTEVVVPVTPGQINDPGIAYLWDESIIPEITVSMTTDEWNRLLKRYDEFSHNVDYFHADFTYRKGNEVFEIEDGGVVGVDPRLERQGSAGKTGSSGMD